MKYELLLKKEDYDDVDRVCADTKDQFIIELLDFIYMTSGYYEVKEE